jgi:hypothetical protein
LEVSETYAYALETRHQDCSLLDVRQRLQCRICVYLPLRHRQTIERDYTGWGRTHLSGSRLSALREFSQWRGNVMLHILRDLYLSCCGTRSHPGDGEQREGGDKDLCFHSEQILPFPYEALETRIETTRRSLEAHALAPPEARMRQQAQVPAHKCESHSLRLIFIEPPFGNLAV